MVHDGNSYSRTKSSIHEQVKRSGIFLSLKEQDFESARWRDKYLTCAVGLRKEEPSGVEHTHLQLIFSSLFNVSSPLKLKAANELFHIFQFSGVKVCNYKFFFLSALSTTIIKDHYCKSGSPEKSGKSRHLSFLSRRGFAGLAEKDWIIINSRNVSFHSDVN